MVITLSSIIYYVAISQAMFGISRFMYIGSVSFYFFKLKRTKEDCLMCIPVFINKSSLCNEFFYKIT